MLECWIVEQVNGCFCWGQKPTNLSLGHHFRGITEFGYCNDQRSRTIWVVGHHGTPWLGCQEVHPHFSWCHTFFSWALVLMDSFSPHFWEINYNNITL